MECSVESVKNLYIFFKNEIMCDKIIFDHNYLLNSIYIHNNLFVMILYNIIYIIVFF